MFPTSQSHSCYAILPGHLAESSGNVVTQNRSDTFWWKTPLQPRPSGQQRWGQTRDLLWISPLNIIHDAVAALSKKGATANHQALVHSVDPY